MKNFFNFILSNIWPVKFPSIKNDSVILLSPFITSVFVFHMDSIRFSLNLGTLLWLEVQLSSVKFCYVGLEPVVIWNWWWIFSTTVEVVLQWRLRFISIHWLLLVLLQCKRTFIHCSTFFKRMWISTSSLTMCFYNTLPPVLA